MADNDKELKAGHAPAVKAGGMRIVQSKPEKTQASGDASPPEDEEEFPAPSPPSKAEKHSQSLLLSGVMTKGDRDFPPEAIKLMHEKPIPKHENRATNMHHNNFPIQQPKK